MAESPFHSGTVLQPESGAASPSLIWFRRDLRLADNRALTAALAEGGPVIPVFVLDPETEAIGAAPRWRLGLSLADLARSLEARGSRLILRRGPAVDVLTRLAAETGAKAVHWTRYYAPDTVARDRAVKSGLKDRGITTASHPGHLIREPWEIATKAGGPFRVFTPFWTTLRPIGAADPLPAPQHLPAPTAWPASDTLQDWRLDAAMNRGAAVVARHVCVGEAAARDRLDAFLRGPISGYRTERNRPDRPGTSHLAENLTYGEISPATIWHAAVRAGEHGAAGAGSFLRELGWRDFAWHLLWHDPELPTANWRRDWDRFPWRGDNPDAERWRRGLTGEALVDAAMREMFVTGSMHNRMRMLVASYLSKHLLTDWRVGRAWFEDCLIDWDPASNALGWQWTAGSGPDAAPYFRVFSPARQEERFDPDGTYRHRFLPGFGQGAPHPDALSYFEAVPRSWNMSASHPYPEPMIDLAEGRKRALAAYEGFRD